VFHRVSGRASGGGELSQVGRGVAAGESWQRKGRLMLDKAMAAGRDRRGRGAAATIVPAREGMGWQRAAILIARLALAYLFFTQLFWKMPPTFSCPPDYRFTTANPDGSLNRSTGLCDWIGIESVWATRPRSLFQANIDNKGGAEIRLPIGPLARANGAFIDNVVKPNIRWMGWLIWGGEAFIFVSLFFGLFSRLGALVAVAISAQLVIGLSGISDPNEWEWAYLSIFFLAVALTGLAPGRFFGLDAALRPRLHAAAAGGNRLARLALAFT
jgi:uncharacterized membrane protein YphA (DoxX/SURF4 family)